MREAEDVQGRGYSVHVLFATDHLFQRAADGGVNTVGGKFPYGRWLEYLSVFDRLTVVGRCGPAHAASAGDERSSGERVTHRLFDEPRGWRRALALTRNKREIAALVEAADAVVVQLPTEYGLAAAAMAERMGKPTLVELVADPWDATWNHGAAATKLYAPVLTWRTRRRVRRAPFVRYVTNHFFQRRYPTDGEWVAASNVILAEPEPHLAGRRRTALAEQRPLVFGTIGAMHTRLKGIAIAIEALAGMKDEIGPFTYRVLGEGDPSPYRRLADRLGIGGQVQFDGTLPSGPSVAAWLDGIDLYLQPSFQEGLPRALIQAMGRGCLAIGSTAGGIPELLPPERTHRPGDLLGLQDRIRALLALPLAARQNEAAAHIEASRAYSYPLLLARKRQIYEKLRSACLSSRAFGGKE